MPDGDNKGWVSLMRTGYHVDMFGRGYHYQVADLERIAANYDPASHRAPLFLDKAWHMSADGDAAGWVDELRVTGSFLEGRLGDVPPGVKQMVADGRRRKVSCEVAMDEGRPTALKRVALLGASVPAIKGLPELDPAAFADGATMAFCENGGNETAWVLMSEEDPMPNRPNNPNPEAGESAQLAQLNEQMAALTTRLDTTEASLAEARQANQALTTRLTAAEGRANRLADEAASREIAALTTRLTAEGRLPPGANTPELVQFVAGLDDTAPTGEGQDGVLMFTTPAAEGQEPEPRPVSPRGFFTAWLGSLPVLVQPGHQFTQPPAGAGDAQDKYTELGKQIAEAG